MVAGGGRARVVEQRVPEAHHGVDLGQLGGQLVAVALGQAAGDHQAGAVAPVVGQRQDGVDRLLAGLVDERAGVDDHDVGGGGVVGLGEPVGDQAAVELVRVDLVLGAAERLHPVGAIRHG